MVLNILFARAGRATVTRRHFSGPNTRDGSHLYFGNNVMPRLYDPNGQTLFPLARHTQGAIIVYYLLSTNTIPNAGRVTLQYKKRVQGSQGQEKYQRRADRMEAENHTTTLLSP